MYSNQGLFIQNQENGSMLLWKRSFHFFVNSTPSPRNEVLQESFLKYILPKFVAQCEENVSQFKIFFPIGCFSLILVNFIGIGYWFRSPKMAGFHIPPLITNTFIRTQLTSYNIKRREVRQLTLIFISGKRTNRCHGKPNRRTKFQKAEFDSYFCLSHVLTLTFGEMLR